MRSMRCYLARAASHTVPRATLQFGQVGHLRPPDQNIENEPFFHTKEVHTYTTSVHYAAHGHVRTHSSCCYHSADSNKPTPIPHDHLIFVFFFVTIPACVYAGERRPFYRGNEVRGEGAGEKRRQRTTDDIRRSWSVSA